MAKESKMNKQQEKRNFIELATKTQARTCIYFNWEYVKPLTCLKEDKIKPCVMLKNQKCPYYKKGITNDR